MLLPNVYFLEAYDILDGVDGVAGLVSHKESLVLQFFVEKMKSRYLLVRRIMKKGCPFFYLIFYLILLSFVSWLRRIVNCVKLPVTAVVRGVGAAIRRVIRPIHTFPHVAFAATVGAFEVQGREFLDIHKKVDHVAFRLQ